MCKAPKPPAPKKPDKPEFLRNAYLDAAVGQSSVVNQLRTGRAGLRIDLASDLAITGRDSGQEFTQVAQDAASSPAAVANPMRPIRRRGQGGRRAELR